jgi:hypothetical protein
VVAAAILLTADASLPPTQHRPERAMMRSKLAAAAAKQKFLPATGRWRDAKMLPLRAPEGGHLLRRLCPLPEGSRF